MPIPRTDITGYISGTMTAIRCVSYDKHCSARSKWLCQCNCGGNHTKIVQQVRFTQSQIKRDPLTCRNYTREYKTGDRIDWLVVIRKMKKKHGQNQWLCQCDCGTIQRQTAQQLCMSNACTCSCGLETGPYLSRSGMKLKDIPIDKRKEFVHLCRTMKKIRLTNIKK